MNYDHLFVEHPDKKAYRFVDYGTGEFSPTLWLTPDEVTLFENYLGDTGLAVVSESDVLISRQYVEEMFEDALAFDKESKEEE